MSISIVNGYVCYNCTDQEKAQKGIDPTNTTNDPSQNKAAVQKREAEKASDPSATAASNALLPSGLGGAVNVSV